MKKLFFVLGISAILSIPVMADGNAFTPLDFNDTQYGSANQQTFSAINTADSNAAGNGNIQNAIVQLDNAEVDIRNDLLNYKTKYADIDAQYKLVKAERKSMKKQISATEKRIKDIGKAKEKIRNNML